MNNFSNSGAPVLDVVVRCRNEMPHTVRTLDALARQRGVVPRIWFFDSRSNDGSRQEAIARGVNLIDVDPRTYIPGRVINDAMRVTTSPIVAFVNADAVPLREDALVKLIEPMIADRSIAAAYGRQRARADAADRTVADHDRVFGSERFGALREGSFFSMAASAVRRDVWKLVSFDETLRFSEDVDWVTRVTPLGFSSYYVPDAPFEHSHDYSLRDEWKRRAGEGHAATFIHHLGSPSPWRELLRPLAGAARRDIRRGDPTPRTLMQRVVQAGGYFAGRVEASRRLG
ncbi:MAG: glycosyltransferase family 2 protein [Polyangiaceae bacterium]